MLLCSLLIAHFLIANITPITSQKSSYITFTGKLMHEENRPL